LSILETSLSNRLHLLVAFSEPKSGCGHNTLATTRHSAILLQPRH
jgi:hypothetical protein